ncbi:MAG: hypothetical protein WCJ40_11105, partial [Planctomycetota bacterium]
MFEDAQSGGGSAEWVDRPLRHGLKVIRESVKIKEVIRVLGWVVGSGIISHRYVDRISLADFEQNRLDC